MLHSSAFTHKENNFNFNNFTTMGFKIINSREYREVCERVAFLESDLDEKNRELELKETTIKRLKKEIVQLEGHLNEVKSTLKELQGNYEAMFNELNELKAAKPEVINFVPDEVKPVYEETVLKVEGESANIATVSKPRRGRKPRAKKDSK